MLKQAVILFLSVIFFTNISAQGNPEADAVTGTWLTAKKDAKVEIYKVDGKFYGKLVWLKEPFDPETGKERVDKHNPDDELKTRPMQGLELLKDFEYDEDNVWEDGEIYDPKNGKNYSCKMTLSEDGKTLEVRGYIGFSLFGRTEVWERAE